jgi:hypothetical protein
VTHGLEPGTIRLHEGGEVRAHLSHAVATLHVLDAARAGAAASSVIELDG